MSNEREEQLEMELEIAEDKIIHLEKDVEKLTNEINTLRTRTSPIQRVENVRQWGESPFYMSGGITVTQSQRMAEQARDNYINGAQQMNDAQRMALATRQMQAEARAVAQAQSEGSLANMQQTAPSQVSDNTLNRAIDYLRGR